MRHTDMKLFSLYYQDNLPNLEYNHRKFCDTNDIQYHKIIINDIAHKYYMIHQILQQNIGEVCIFIDQYSFFKNFKFDFDFKADAWVQKSKISKHCLDNFLIIKSNNNTIKVIHEIMRNTATALYTNHKILDIDFPSEWIIDYPFQQNKKYLNVNLKLHADAMNANSLVFCIDYFYNNITLAELMCDYKPSSYSVSDEKFSVINPGKSKALVTLYTPNIKGYASIAEYNFIQYCMRNDISLYIYRDIPDKLVPMNGTWTKPYLLLDHMDEHEHIAWIDADILINNNYKIDWSHEICLYSDPLSPMFNAGYICIKNTEKNKQMLNRTIELFKPLGNLDSVYVHGGDQTYFIKAVKEIYPDFVPFSNEYGNSHISVPKLRLPTDPYMFHFMGYEYHIRIALMDYYQQQIMKQK